ncbi:MAG: hypothetical protein UZ21_OP11001000381 [Microgenomates bacterium OLB22]|nr:MAG: hypothetical protein UZ21_OP11001000381 [Microgenomates bacterium OLB22]
MYITKEKVLKWSAIALGVILAGLLLWLVFQYIQRSRASNLTAADVKISDITSNSFTVCYQTTSGLTPVVKYGTDPANLNLLAPPTSVVDVDGGESLYCHKVFPLVGPTYHAIVQLSPDNEVDNAGTPFMINLLSGSAQPPVPTSAVAVSPTTLLIPTSAAAPTTVAPTVDFKLCCPVDANSDGQVVDIPSGCTAFDAIRCKQSK